jgi:hypothetical protein
MQGGPRASAPTMAAEFGLTAKPDSNLDTTSGNVERSLRIARRASGIDR